LKSESRRLLSVQNLSKSYLIVNEGRDVLRVYRHFFLTVTVSRSSTWFWDRFTGRENALQVYSLFKFFFYISRIQTYIKSPEGRVESVQPYLNFWPFFRKFVAKPGFSRGTRQRLNPQRVQVSIFFLVLVMVYSRLGLFLYRAPLDISHFFAFEFWFSCLRIENQKYTLLG